MAGFKLINEARDFILHLNEKSESVQVGHVFAPVRLIANYYYPKIDSLTLDILAAFF